MKKKRGKTDISPIPIFKTHDSEYNLNTFNHASLRFDAEYAASISKVFTIIPSQEDLHASLKNKFILDNVFWLFGHASSASTYKIAALEINVLQ